MARKKVIDLDASTVVGFGSEKGQIPAGKEVSGYYIGSREVETGMGKSKLHVLQTEDGNLGLWGSAQLNTKLAQIQPGTMVFVTYKKKIKVAKGTMKTFDVEYDDEDAIDVGGVQMNFNNSQEPEDVAEDAEDEDDGYEAAADEDVDQDEVEEEEEEVEERNPVRSKPAASARPADRKTAAGVESLLKKTKR